MNDPWWENSDGHGFAGFGWATRTGQGDGCGFYGGPDMVGDGYGGDDRAPSGDSNGSGGLANNAAQYCAAGGLDDNPT